MPRQPFLTEYGGVSPLKPPALEQSILGSRYLVGLGTEILLYLIPRSLPGAAGRQHCRKPS